MVPVIVASALECATGALREWHQSSFIKANYQSNYVDFLLEDNE